MDSCFFSLSILGHRGVNKLPSNEQMISTDNPSKNVRTREIDSTVHNLSGKFETLEDLDLYYVRQLAHNSKEYDLERKIELEVKIREGSSRLLAAARHPAQSLEAARALLTSNERMTAYMAELYNRKKAGVASNTSINPTRAKLVISDLRFPLMWRETDHFKNRGDHRRYAVFCLIRVNTEIHDTCLVYPVDREQTDISFPDTLTFNNVPAEFQLNLEMYAHVLQEDLSIASTPRRIRSSIHSSISKTVGKRLAMALRDEFDSAKTGPQFDLVARATLTLDDTDAEVRTHDLLLRNSFENKHQALPLFEHFCCRLAIQPDCFKKEICAGCVKLNGTHCWAQLADFQLKAWESKKLAEDQKKPSYTVSVNRDTVIKRSKSKSKSKELQIINFLDGIQSSSIISLDSKEDTEKWFDKLMLHINDHSTWKHAALVVQQVPCMEGSKNLFVSDGCKRQGSLYDETPLIETLASMSETNRSKTSRSTSR